MIIRYSLCHFADVIDEPERVALCSFCGKECGFLPQARLLTQDIELTLRRWKDGDCSLDDMFDRVNREFDRAFYDIFRLAQMRIQRDQKPEYEFNQVTGRWDKNE